MNVKRPLLALSWLILAALTAPAAVPSPDKLLPADTLVVLTIPDYAKTKAASEQWPMVQLWRDPAMAPFKDKFVNKFTSDVVTPLEHELGIKWSDYADLAQGQVTFAVTLGGLTGGAKSGPGFLLLIDAGAKSAALKDTLASLKKKWVDSGKSLKSEKIRDIDFTTLIFSKDELKKSLEKAFPSTADADEPKGPAKKMELLVGQSDSLLVIGSAASDIEKILVRQSGGGSAGLSDQAQFSSSYNSTLREATAYGWVNAKTLIDLATKQLAKANDGGGDDDNKPGQGGMKYDKMIASLGFGALQSVAFSMKDAPDGTYANVAINVPESGRRGLFKMLAFEARDAAPLNFIPADVTKFSRWRIDLPKMFTQLENTLVEVIPQVAGVIKLIMDTAGKDKDPNFDLRQGLIANLGDDIVRYEKAPRKQTLADLSDPPSITLISSPKAEQLAAALKVLAITITQQPSKIKEREFLGRKVYALPLPSMGAPPGGGKPVEQTLHFVASGGYVALSSDVVTLEEYLRNAGSAAKPLRETSALTDAAQKVGGMGTGLLGYENQTETARSAFEILKKESGTLANLLAGSPIAGKLGVDENGKQLKEWIDFSLLPSFDKVAKYFGVSVWAGSTTADGFQLKAYGPNPPQLRK